MNDSSPTVCLSNILRRGRVNSLKVTPGHLSLIALLGAGEKSGIRTVIVGGEQLNVELAANIQRILGRECRIYNEYGPTETTVGCVVHLLDPSRKYSGPSVPIGLPIAGTEISLFDGGANGVNIGEIFIGGNGLSPGYLGASQVQNSAFLTLGDGRRVYRTGDLARVLENGELEYLGRIGQELKVNGYRVDVDEIQQRIQEFHCVSNAFVRIGTGERAHGSRITAFVVPKQGFELSDLQKHLSELLPSYMLPHEIIKIESIPLNANGKVDQVQLTTSSANFWSASEIQSNINFLSENEKIVAKIWQKVLGINADQLEGRSNFFELGGDSITMAEMLDQVGRTFMPGRNLSQVIKAMQGLYSEPTVENFGNFISKL